MLPYSFAFIVMKSGFTEGEGTVPLCSCLFGCMHGFEIFYLLLLFNNRKVGKKLEILQVGESDTTSSIVLFTLDRGSKIAPLFGSVWLS